MSDRTAGCTGKCDWAPWMQATPAITDMLFRHCAECGMREIRVLPPNVGSGRFWRTYADMVAEAHDDLTWNGTREEGE